MATFLFKQNFDIPKRL